MKLFQSDSVSIRQGDCLEQLRLLPDDSVDTILTSPPYYGLCDYEVEGQYGHETTLDEYLWIQTLVFRECRRVLQNGGVAWIVIGDSSNNYSSIRAKGARRAAKTKKRRPIQKGIPEKSLLRVPHKLGASLEQDGWYWRNALVWDKGSCGSIGKSDTAPQTHETILQMGRWDGGGRPYFNCRGPDRSVLHYATTSDPTHPCPFPEGLVEELLLSSSEGHQTVLDPYTGSGTTLAVAQNLGRKSIGIELKPEFFDLAVTRCQQLTLFTA